MGLLFLGFFIQMLRETSRQTIHTKLHELEILRWHVPEYRLAAKPRFLISHQEG